MTALRVPRTVWRRDGDDSGNLLSALVVERCRCRSASYAGASGDGSQSRFSAAPIRLDIRGRKLPVSEILDEEPSAQEKNNHNRSY